MTITLLVLVYVACFGASLPVAAALRLTGHRRWAGSVVAVTGAPLLLARCAPGLASVFAPGFASLPLLLLALAVGFAVGSVPSLMWLTASSNERDEAIRALKPDAAGADGDTDGVRP